MFLQEGEEKWCRSLTAVTPLVQVSLLAANP
jgi:hypothetical protein